MIDTSEVAAALGIDTDSIRRWHSAGAFLEVLALLRKVTAANTPRTAGNGLTGAQRDGAAYPYRPGTTCPTDVQRHDLGRRP